MLKLILILSDILDVPASGASQRKKSLKLYFYQKLHFINLSSDIWFGKVFLKLAQVQIFFRRAQVKVLVGSILK